MKNVDVKCDKCGQLAYMVLVNVTCIKGNCNGTMRPLKALMAPVKCSVEKPCEQCIKLGAKPGVALSGNRSVMIAQIICPTCRKGKEKCNCEYCHNCKYYKANVFSRLDGDCMLSMDDDNVRMVASDMSYPDEPVLNVSVMFGCNQWKSVK